MREKRVGGDSNGAAFARSNHEKEEDTVDGGNNDSCSITISGADSEDTDMNGNCSCCGGLTEEEEGEKVLFALEMMMLLF